MSYQRPLVMVFQEYAQMSVATRSAILNPCIVGPCYTIIDAVEDENLAFVGPYTDAGVSDEFFPNNPAGGQIEEESVVVRLKNPVIRITATAEETDDITDNVLTFIEANFPVVEKGDIIKITDITTIGTPVAVEGDFRVIDQNTTTWKLFLNRIPDIGAGTAFEVMAYRDVDDIFLDYHDADLTLALSTEKLSLVGVNLEVESVDKLVVSANLFVSYRSLRTDLTGINTIYNTNEAKALLGRIDTHYNPLGLGIATALANTTVGVKCIGVGSDNTAGFTAAKDKLELYDDVYAIVPLSQSAAILNIFSMHAAQMSVPEVGRRRVAIGSVPIPTEKELESGTGTTKNDAENDLIVFQDTDASFLSNGATAGHTLRATGSDSVVYEYTIATVLSEDILTIAPLVPFKAEAFTNGGTADYTIIQDLNRTQQAQEVKSISSSFGSARFVHTFPDKCEIDGNEVPGYYLSCTVAGAIGGLPSHHGFTRLSVAGIGKLTGSNDYFNQEQLDIIAGGGTFIFTQENPQAAPVIRHQLTTDMSTIELSELSFVKNFDYVSKLSQDVLDEFLGQYNINEATLGVLDTAMRSVLKSLMLYSLPKIGSPVLGFDIISTEQLDEIRDRVEMYVEVDFPYALNKVGLHLISR